jgi:hypothetical protein
METDVRMHGAAAERTSPPFDPFWDKSDLDRELGVGELDSARARPRLGLPVVIAAGVLGLTWLGLRLLSSKRSRGARSSLAADALRTVALSMLGVVSNRVAERLADSTRLLSARIGR